MQLCRRFIAGLVVGCAFGGAVLGMRAAERPLIAVTTSLLGTAVRDVAGDTVDLETLLPPGLCPSQFDLEPAQVGRVLGATVFLRHEFQPFLDPKLVAVGLDRSRIAASPASGSLGLPVNYVRLCNWVAGQLAARLPERAESFFSGAAAVATRADVVSAAALLRAKPLRGRSVLAAQHQAEFVRWLGLEAQATFSPSADPTPAMLLQAVAAARAAGVVAVIGNAPNGRRAPEALGEALHRPVVMLENFPSATAPESFWRMLDQNVGALLAGIPR